jgi:hypothetical protein
MSDLSKCQKDSSLSSNLISDMRPDIVYVAILYDVLGEVSYRRWLGNHILQPGDDDESDKFYFFAFQAMCLPFYLGNLIVSFLFKVL